MTRLLLVAAVALVAGTRRGWWMMMAAAGDTIEVASGTYVENVDVGKRFTLIRVGRG